MSDLKFVPQSMLDVWSDLGKVQLDGTTLRLPGEGVEFALSPAVRFLAVLEGEDRHKLMHKVKAESFVKEIGGEVMDDSCLVGDTAYQVQAGFLAEGAALAAAQTAKATRKLASKVAPAAPAPVVAPPPAKPAPKDDADLLTQFLLESLD